MAELLQKVTDRKPAKPGSYITNFGTLVFDGKDFLMTGHERRTPTSVEYWLTDYIPVDTTFEEKVEEVKS